MIFTRRDIGKLALAALPAAAIVGREAQFGFRRRAGGHQCPVQLPQHSRRRLTTSSTT